MDFKPGLRSVPEYEARRDRCTQQQLERLLESQEHAAWAGNQIHPGHAARAWKRSHTTSLVVALILVSALGCGLSFTYFKVRAHLPHPTSFSWLCGNSSPFLQAPPKAQHSTAEHSAAEYSAAQSSAAELEQVETHLFSSQPEERSLLHHEYPSPPLLSPSSKQDVDLTPHSATQPVANSITDAPLSAHCLEHSEPCIDTHSGQVYDPQQKHLDLLVSMFKQGLLTLPEEVIANHPSRSFILTAVSATVATSAAKDQPPLQTDPVSPLMLNNDTLLRYVQPPMQVPGMLN